MLRTKHLLIVVLGAPLLGCGSDFIADWEFGTPDPDTTTPSSRRDTGPGEDGTFRPTDSAGAADVADSRIAPSDVSETLRDGDDEIPPWSRQFGSGESDVAMDLAVSRSGGVYVTGFTGDGLFGRPFHGGSTDAFLSRYDAAGNHVWTRILGTSGFERGYSVSADGKGHIYVAGRTSGPLGSRSYNGGKTDGFLVKFEETGKRVWTRLQGTDVQDETLDVEADDDGNLYVTGETGGALGGRTHNGDKLDTFVAKYDPSGKRRWVRLLGSPEWEWAFAIATHRNDAVYIAGRAKTSLAGRGYAGGRFDGFLAKFGVDGRREWVRLQGTPGNDWARAVTTDGAGNVLVGGHTDRELHERPYNGGKFDVYVSSYAPDGSRNWTRLVGTPGSESIRTLEADETDEIHLVGRITASLGGEPHLGSGDGLYARFTSEWTRRAVRLVGTSQNDHLYDVDIGPSRGIFVTGATDGHVAGSKPYGGSDGFLMKIR